MHPLSDVHVVWVMLFYFYIAFVYFAVLNVITGVFCSSAIESASRDLEAVSQAQLEMRDFYTKTVKSIFQMMDGDESGTISLEEFQEGFRNHELQAYFQSLELDPKDAMTLFKLLARDDDDEVIYIQDFVDGCLRLRGWICFSVI